MLRRGEKKTQKKKKHKGEPEGKSAKSLSKTGKGTEEVEEKNDPILAERMRQEKPLKLRR